MALCGAKTRQGTPCQRPAGWGTDHVGSGKCKLHGGKSTGPPPEKMTGNKNAVTTGEYEAIFIDTLDDDERVLLGSVNVDVLSQLDEQIRLVTIRERRMLQRIAKLKSGPDMMPVVMEKSNSEGVGGKSKHQMARLESTIESIQRIEEALTRVQTLKVRLLQQKFDVLSHIDKDDEETNGVLRELAEAIEMSARMAGGAPT